MAKHEVWTLRGSVINRLSRSNDLSSADLLIIEKVISEFENGFHPPKSDTRIEPDFQEADIVMVMLKQHGFNTDKSDTNRRKQVYYHALAERREGNTSASEKLFSGLLNGNKRRK